MKKVLLVLNVLLSFNAVAQVNYQTGSANLSIPMFDWQDDKSRLTSAISLNYSSGNGIRTADVSSNAGQGWNLQIGGYITRIQAGQPDDQYPRDGNIEDITKYPAGYLYDAASASAGCPGDLQKYPIFKDRNHIYKPHINTTADKELDKFAFQINGRSGLFVVAKGNNNKGILIGDSRVKVWYSLNALPGFRTMIDAFFIQDENGIIYKFTRLSSAKVLKVSFSDATGTRPIVQPKFEENKVYDESFFDEGLPNANIATGWYMTEMEDILTGRKVLLSYTDRTVNTEAGTSISYYGEKAYAIITHNVSKTIQPELTSIQFPDGHAVSVNYGAPRTDMNGAFAIESVDVKYQNQYISKYVLNTEYLILNRVGTPETDFQKKMSRLILKSVQKVGINLASSDKPFSFEYYTGSTAAADDIVPPPFSAMKDIWGYYNGNNSKGFNNEDIPVTADLTSLDFQRIKGLCFLRTGNQLVIGQNTKSGYAKNGLLKKIYYPGGGSLKYEYNQNEALLNNQNAPVGGVHVTKTTVSDEGNNNNCEVSNNETNYTYRNSSNTQSSLWGIENPVNNILTSSFYAPANKKFKLFGFKCVYKYKYPGIMARDQAIDLSGREKFMEAFSAVMDVVGTITTVMDIITLISAGTGVGAVIVGVISAIITIILTCFKDFTQNSTSNVYYNSDLNSNTLPMQFKRAEITESSGNGKTVMEFTSTDDYPVWSSDPLHSFKQRYANWAYGLPKKVTVYDASGNKVKETENVYNYQNAQNNNAIEYENGTPATIAINVPSCKCEVKRMVSERSDVWATPNTNTASYITQMTAGQPIQADIYTVKTGRTELQQTIERVYKQGTSDFLATTTDYAYDPNTLLPNLVTTTQSNGDQILKSTKYTGNAYQYGNYQGVLSQLASKNILHIPVATKTVLKKAPSQTLYDLSETVTEFTPLATGDIKPSLIKERRYEQPTTPTGNYYSGPTSPATAAINYKTIQSFIYDTDGNMIAQLDEGGRRVAHFYDYNDKYITATVINSMMIGDEATAYTSFETSNTGNWQITGPLDYSTMTAITGTRSLNLNTENSIAPKYNGGINIISFWATDPLEVTGATLEKSGPIVNGFTYYEYLTINDSNNPLVISGNATIDELRRYPTRTRMRSVSYDPIIGKTSECDENNRLTYYEYDEKGRTRNIKDQEGNIIKMYEYNEAVKNNPACSTQVIYTHPQITELYTMECKGENDQIGTVIPYIIPAGTYTSTVSQAVVDDLIADDLLANGQLYANTTGECNTVYFNAAISRTYNKEGCDVGYVGTTYTYTIPENSYSSIISQLDAHNLARAELNANGQAMANLPGNAECIITTEPDWEGTGNEECGTHGFGTGHLAIEVIDINPNSNSYNEIQWIDGGLSAACGADVPAPMDITYTNAGNMQATAVFTNTVTNEVFTLHLDPNTTTASVAGYVMTGTYTITVTVPFGSNAQTIRVYNTIQQAPFNQTPVTVNTTAPAIIQITL